MPVLATDDVEKLKKGLKKLFKVEFSLKGNKLIAEVPNTFLETLNPTTKEIFEELLAKHGYVMIDKQAASIGKFHLVEEEHALGNVKIMI